MFTISEHFLVKLIYVITFILLEIIQNIFLYKWIMNFSELMDG